MLDNTAYEALPGETAPEYIRRMHGKRCDCPRAYSRCRWAVIFDGGAQGHGGWGQQWADRGPVKVGA
jgi:hypothetical protein